MQKRILTFLFLCTLAALLSTSANGQTLTQVSGTITDPNGLPYSNATISIQLSGGGSTPQTTPCASSPCNVVNPNPIQTDAAGKFSIALWANGSITPASTQWSFLVQEPGVAPPWGLGPKSFTLTTTISGATQSLSSAMDALAPALTPAFSGGSATPCTTAPFAVQINNAGAFGCNANFTYNPSTGLVNHAEAGTFTVAQQNRYTTSVLNGPCPYNAIIGGPPTITTDAISGCVVGPTSGQTNGFNVGVGGYAQQNDPTNDGQFGRAEGVGVFGGCEANANTVFCLGMAPAVYASTNDTTGVTLEGEEVGVTPGNTIDAGDGILFSMEGGNVQPAGDQLPAAVVQTPTGSATYTSGYECQPAATASQNCVVAGKAAKTGETHSQMLGAVANSGVGDITGGVQLQPGQYWSRGGGPWIQSTVDPVGGEGEWVTSTNNLSFAQLVCIDTTNPLHVIACGTGATTGIGFVVDQQGSGANGLCTAGSAFCAVVSQAGALVKAILDSGTCTTGQFVINGTTTAGDVKCTGSQPAQGSWIGIAWGPDSTPGTTFSILTKFQ